MQITQPDYYKEFSCIATECPDTCCVGWQVVLDAEHFAQYQAIPGSLGEEIREGIVNIDGEASFRLCNGRCCMLRDDGLCKIQYSLGEQALSSVCGFYPRFVTELGLMREQGLSISCPEVARIILSRKDPISYETHVTQEPLRYFHDIEPETILRVKKGREEALVILQDRAVPLTDRLLRIMQLIVDRTMEDCSQVSESEHNAFYSGLYQLFLSLEQLRPDWGEILHRCSIAQRKFIPDNDLYWEQLMSYYLFKYSLRSAMDDDFEEKLCLSVLCILLLRDICCKENLDIIYLVQLFSKETEHNEENLAVIENAVQNDPQFSPLHLCRILSAE